MPKVYLLSEVSTLDGNERIYVTDDPTGTPTDGYVTVDTLQRSHPEVITIALGAPATAIDTVGAIAGAYWFPHEAITVTGVFLFVVSATTTGVLTLDINEADTSILSTKLTIDATELTSLTAVAPAVISDASIAAGAKVSFDWDVVGDSTATDAYVAIEYTRAV